MRVDRLLKADGAGNDFLIGFGSWARRLDDDPELVRRLCHRRRGVGADGAIGVLDDPGGGLRLAHRNADGSRSAFCANGTRCAAVAARRVLGLGPRMVLVTGWTTVPAAVTDDGRVALDLPPPAAPPRALELAAAGRRWAGRLLVVGVPHLVVPVDDPEAVDLAVVGPALRHHPALGPDGANVDLVSIGPGSELMLRTFERGVEDETWCCGTGAVAATIAVDVAVRAGGATCRCRSGDRLTVDLLGPPPCPPVRLTGPARLVAEIEPVTP